MIRELRPIIASMLIMLLVTDGHEVAVATLALAAYASAWAGYRWIRG